MIVKILIIIIEYNNIINVCMLKGIDDDCKYIIAELEILINTYVMQYICDCERLSKLLQRQIQNLAIQFHTHAT